MKVMDEQPQNVVDMIEDMSLDVKRAIFEGTQSTLRDLPQITAAVLLAEQQHLLFSRPEDADREEELVLPTYIYTAHLSLFVCERAYRHFGLPFFVNLIKPGYVSLLIEQHFIDYFGPSLSGHGLRTGGWKNYLWNQNVELSVLIPQCFEVCFSVFLNCP